MQMVATMLTMTFSPFMPVGHFAVSLHLPTTEMAQRRKISCQPAWQCRAGRVLNWKKWSQWSDQTHACTTTSSNTFHIVYNVHLHEHAPLTVLNSVYILFSRMIYTFFSTRRISNAFSLKGLMIAEERHRAT